MEFKLQAMIESGEYLPPDPRTLTPEERAKLREPLVRALAVLDEWSEKAVYWAERRAQMYDRMIAGETQADIARDLGVTPQCVNQLIKKERKRRGV